MQEMVEAAWRQHKNCSACPLCQTRRKVVFVTGNPDAKIMLVVDPPTPAQDKSGSHATQDIKWLVKLLGDKTFFSGDLVQAGDISVFSIINLAFKAGLTNCLDNFPTLLSHYNAVSRIGNIPKYIEANHAPYFVVPK